MSTLRDTTESFRFGTKAETLTRLARLIRSATLLPLVFFTAREWADDRESCLRRVFSHTWSSGTLIVRSSCHEEDGILASNAGRFLSCLNIRGTDELTTAIETVFASFDGDRSDDQVLIQPQLNNVVASGVVSSHVPESGAPYRVVQWTAGSETDAVTSGSSAVCTWYFLDEGKDKVPDPKLAAIPQVVAELETLCAGRPFEFEFAISADPRPALFQLRPLVGVHEKIPRERHRRAVADCRTRARDFGVPGKPQTAGATVLGVMPDWNPAEMIGIRPRPLALSLYRELITDTVWAESRFRYGYRDLRGVPLIVDLNGLPYIDTRASFSSLVPLSLNEDVARRLVDYYVATLRNEPWLHDKVEFAIVLSSYHFATPDRAGALVEREVLSADEADMLVNALRELTIRMIAKQGPYEQDLRAIRGLELRSIERNGHNPSSYIRALRDQCRRLGTLPFAGLARAAFVATALLRSLVETGTLSQQEADSVVTSVPTPTTVMHDDLAHLSRAAFLRKYGHLRPGTYDICSPRYDEDPERYFDWSVTSPSPADGHELSLSDRQLAELNRELEHDHWPVRAHDLLRFIAESVAAREFGKLQFTRFVSEILLSIRRLGESRGFSADDMSYVDLSAVTDLTGRFYRDRHRIADAINQGKERYAITRSLCAPAVLSDLADLTSFTSPPGEANFVTQSRVTAPTADVAAGDEPKASVAMIEAADPGYDWIFTRGVAGLVTAYGGVNSHMAIRARELGIPAAIGVGYEQFRRWQREPVLEIDAAARLVRPAALGIGERS
ncbi:PEP-utilizing enzyme [Amycolatopsis pithecellobii]|nr:PEP-utilizing enzyme [Amycolatopsis pithecellobii]